MKQAENNEIDILLRSLARRKRRGARFQTDTDAGAAAELQPAGSHLDPDELNSYAEGKLPAAARGRYATHLADCDDCRVLVGQLTIASGVLSTQRAEERVGPKSTWKEKLAALLAPNVLRYAVPALVLVAVGVVGLLVLRQPKEPSLVARNSEATPAQTINDQTKRGSESSGAIALDDGRQNQQQQKQKTPQPEASGEVKNASKKEVSNSPTPSSREEAEKEKDSKSEAVAEARPRADTPAPAAAAPALAKAADTAKEQPAKATNEKRSDDEDQAAQNRDEQRNVANVAGQRGPSASKINSQVAARKAKPSPGEEARGGGGVSGRARRSESESETRTIAGRRFRKQDDAWIDTAYDGSATINVTRGSEQYRALVGDEPEIDRIAQQLSGEVVIVWKGRAYRIR